MIFELDNREFESEKERNLYYKFFAGFYFNELIPGYEVRVEGFYSLLRQPTYQVGDIPMDRLQVPPKAVLVSFDNHPDRFFGQQSGEFADILVHDSQNGILVGIEAKYLDDWDYQKDIVKNSEKLASVGAELGTEVTLLCLLVPRAKWENVVAMEAHPGSNFRRLKEHAGTASVLLWEDFVEPQGVPPLVQSYVKSQLDNPRLRTRNPTK
jgi:hypothetical protein